MRIPRFLRPWTWVDDPSPMTDPRSLASSLLVHGLLVAIVSAAAFSGGERLDINPPPKSIKGMLDPLDNRDKSTPEGEGGGGPGEIGSEQFAPALDPKPANSEFAKSAALNPTADALLAEILPTTPSMENTHQTLPGPQTSSLITTPGDSLGGAGGSGGGTGGGVGRGTGPGTEFFGERENATSFAYVIDCSGSMMTLGSLDKAKRELSASLGQLPPDAKFAVIFYNLRATMMSDPQGRKGLMAATQANKARVGTQLTAVTPDGGTDHMVALRTAFALKPEVIFFLTDADILTNSEVGILLSEAGTTRIQAVEFGRGVELGAAANPLRKLATSTGGHYRYIDVTRFQNAR